MLAALVPERVLPFGSGDSRKRGPEPSRGSNLGDIAAVERRKASAPPNPPPQAGEEGEKGARRRAGDLVPLRLRTLVDALIGAPPPSFLREDLGRASLKREAKLGCEGASREGEHMRHCEEAQRADEAIQGPLALCKPPWIASLRSQ